MNKTVVSLSLLFASLALGAGAADCAWSNDQVVVTRQAQELRFFRSGARAPFAAWGLPDDSAVDFSVTLEEHSPWVAVSLAPRPRSADYHAGVLNLPEITLRTFDAKPVSMRSDGLRPVDGSAPSCGYLAVAEPFTRRGVVVAWLTNLRASGALATRTDGSGRVCVQPIADYGRMTVRTGKRPESDTIVIGDFDDCRRGLEDYAEAAARRLNIHLPANRSGYCTWCSDRYGFSDRSEFKAGAGCGTEASTLRLAEEAARKLKPYGFEFVQFDDQWQAGGENNGPARNFFATDARGPYPNGFASVVRALNAQGFTAGLWFIPFGGDAADPSWADCADCYVKSAVEIPVDEKGDAYRRPVALARKKGGPIRTIWGGECLDMTNPKARARLANTVRRFTYDWGFRYLKCDGIFTGMGGDLYGGYAWADVHFSNAVFADPEASNVSAFRQGLRTLREAAAPGTFILGCNLGTIRAMVPAYGLVDGMRIGNDNGPIDQHPERYFEGPLAGSMRYFLNGRVWWNDPDSTYVRAATPLGRARSMASWTALTDSLYEVGDWLGDLPEERVELLRRTMAHHGSRCVRPIDYFEKPVPNGWILDGGRSKILGLFNWETNQTLKIDWSAAYAGLDPAKTYVGYDFWRHQFVPPFSGTVRFEVPADDCRVIALAEVRSGETLLSTSLHVASPIYGVRGHYVLTVANEPLEVRTYSDREGFRTQSLTSREGGWVKWDGER